MITTATAPCLRHEPCKLATLEREGASEQDLRDACTGGATMVDTMQTASIADVLDALEEAGGAPR